MRIQQKHNRKEIMRETEVPEAVTTTPRKHRPFDIIPHYFSFHWADNTDHKVLSRFQLSYFLF